MHESHGWLLDTRTMWIVLSVWVAAVLLHGLSRSRGEGAQDPIRESGPIL